jgi:ATPase subunit of ABC transporter with duplicated ATPase domains
VNGRALVDDARVVLARGQRYGLIGKNGCGKSALLQALASPGSRALQGLDPAALRCALVTQEHPSLLQQCTVVSE